MNARDERGYALAIVVIVTAALLAAGVASINITRFELRSGAQQTAKSQSLYIAEAGIQRALTQLAWDRDYAANHTTYRYPSSGTRMEAYDTGTYAFWIEQDPQFSTDPTHKLVTATGYRAGQSSQVVSHAVVQPSSGCCATPSPTAGFQPSPTAAVPPEVPGTQTPSTGPQPTPTPGVYATPTPTSTPIEGSPFGRVCDNNTILMSYGGTAKLINTAAAASQLFNGNIFSNGNVEFQVDAQIANNATGTVRAGGDFVNSGLGLGVLSNLSSTNLYYEGTYLRAPLDALTHLLWPLAAVGVHFANPGAQPYHGVDVGVGGIPDVRPWRPDWDRLRRRATYVISRESSLPFGSWDTSTGTWVVGTQSFATGSSDTYYVEGNVKITGLQLTRTASPTIAARGWISVRALTVLATGLLGSDVQNVNLVAESHVGIGREVLNMSTGVLQTVDAALLSGGTGIGLNLATLGSRMNLFAYSERGEAFAMVGTAVAAARLRACVVADDDATLARTVAALSTVRSLDSAS